MFLTVVARHAAARDGLEAGVLTVLARMGYMYCVPRWLGFLHETFFLSVGLNISLLKETFFFFLINVAESSRMVEFEAHPSFEIRAFRV
jgi:hypothetical protein